MGTEYELASQGRRLVNVAVDAVAIFICVQVLRAVTSAGEGFTTALTWLGWIGYYTLCEGMTGRTMGKVVTGTCVINVHGESISLGEAAARTLCRIIPFEFISAFANYPVCWHDSIAGTRVVRQRSVPCEQIEETFPSEKTDVRVVPKRHVRR